MESQKMELNVLKVVRPCFFIMFLRFCTKQNIYFKTVFVLIDIYSVMQSLGNSFCGDVVSVSFNKTYRDEDSILDQIFKIKYVRIIIMMILILYNIIRKFILTLQKNWNPILWVPCCYVPYFFKYAYSSITIKI